MKRSDMLTAIWKVLDKRRCTNAWETADLILSICEEEGMLPPVTQVPMPIKHEDYLDGIVKVALSYRWDHTWDPEEPQ